MATPEPEEAAPRRRREHEVTRAAIDVFWQKGYPAASVADVAERVGMLKGSLYYYIDSKEDLLDRIFSESNHQAVAIVAEVAALDSSSLERLRAYVQRYVLWYLTNVEQVSLYFSEWRHLTGERRQRALDQRETFERFVRGLIEGAKEDGDVAAELDTRTALFFLLGAMNAVSTWYRRDGELTAEQIAEEYAGLAIGMVVGTTPQGARGADPAVLASQALEAAARRLRGRFEFDRRGGGTDGDQQRRT